MRPILFFLIGCLVPPSFGQGTFTVTTDIRYHTAATRTGLIDLHLDAYVPDTTVTNRPALVLVHGGSFTSGDRTSPDMVQAAEFFAARGWVCFSIQYRLAGDDPPSPFCETPFCFPQLNAVHAAMVDTKRAIRWVRANAAAHGIDPRRVAALGHSAGAGAVLLAGITDEEDFANDDGPGVPDFLPSHSGKPNAVVEVSGADGFSYQGFSTNLAHEFTADDPPLMVWHSDADATVPFQEATDIVDDCRAVGIPHRFFALSGVAHGADTWLATSGGEAITDHAHRFLTRVLAPTVVLGPGAPFTLEAGSVSNLAVEVWSAPLTDPAGGGLQTVVTARTDRVRVALPTPGLWWLRARP